MRGVAPRQPAWSLEQATAELDRLIGLAAEIKPLPRHGAEVLRWRANAATLLLGVFGPESLSTRSFLALSFAIRGQLAFDTDDLREFDGYRLEGTAHYIERKQEEAAKRDLDSAVGLLMAARDELVRFGVASVYRDQRPGQEASELLGVIALVDRQLRKVIREVPTKEKAVQDALENLLLGAQLAYTRETVAIEYSSKTYRPDFTVEELALAIDVKLCDGPSREKDLSAEINDDILAYQTRYPNVLFVVYDTGAIRDIDRFVGSFEKHAGVLVRVIKH